MGTGRESYRLECEHSSGDDVAFEFKCDNGDGLHMTAVSMLQEMFEPGKMGRLYVRGEFTAVRGKNGKMMEGHPWKHIGSFDADNLFVAKE
jgi:hypothetical protein